MTSTSSEPIDLLFLGTGTSTGLPLVPCLTRTSDYPAGFARHVPLIEPAPGTQLPPGSYDPQGEWPDNIPCACCRSAVSEDVPEGWKNRRGNTSVVVRKHTGGRTRNVVVDVGKTFKEQTQRFFPKWGIETIDAVILTHGHADAYFGLDDLREWCQRQRATIPIYLNKETYAMVASSFPYLVDKSKASGGGDVPSLRFHIIADDEDFEVEGIRVRALAAEHGIYFEESSRRPLICLGFMFDESIIYMSDVSSIPESTWERMLDRRRPDTSGGQKAVSQVNGTGYSAHASPVPDALGKVVVPPTPQDTPKRGQSPVPINGLSSLSISSSSAPYSNGHTAASSTESQPRLPILVIDALWPIARHSSHTNLVEAVEIAMRLDPLITYVVDVVHPVTHFMWEELGLSIQGKDGQRKGHPDDAQAADLIRRWWADEQVAGTDVGQKVRQWAGRLEPGWDGLVVRVKDGEWEEVKGKKGSTRGWTQASL